MGNIEHGNRSWEEIRDAKKAEQDSRIPADWKLNPKTLPTDGTRDLRPYAASSGILSDRELKITGDDYDATALAAAIADSTYTAVEVVTAFCKRAAIAQQLCNCLTEIAFAEAIEKAVELDQHYQATGNVVGPLHGVPMTFKVTSSIK
jgi:amidase